MKTKAKVTAKKIDLFLRAKVSHEEIRKRRDSVTVFLLVFQHLVNIKALKYVFTVPRPKLENFLTDNLR